MTNFAKPQAPMHLYTTTEIEPSCIFLSSQDLSDTVKVKIILLLIFKKNWIVYLEEIVISDKNIYTFTWKCF